MVFFLCEPLQLCASTSTFSTASDAVCASGPVFLTVMVCWCGRLCGTANRIRLNLDRSRNFAGVVDALGRLHEAGYRLIVVTNQPDVARGTRTRAMVEAQHAALRADLPLSNVRVCYHTDGDGCTCRKPLPGLLLGAAQEYSINLASIFIVGNRWRDVEAGLQAGCTTIFINCNYAEALLSRPHVQVYSPPKLTDWILTQRHRHSDKNP